MSGEGSNVFSTHHRGTYYTIAVMELPSTRLRSLPLFSPALLEVVTSPLLPATSTYESYECCTHEDSVATGEAGSQKQIGILWPDQETQEMQGFFSLPHSLLLWPEAMATAAV